MLDQKHLENSPDLSDVEISVARETSSMSDLAHKIGQKCSTCGEPTAVIKHSIRRRLPHTYWRVGLLCNNGHPERETFVIDWLS